MVVKELHEITKLLFDHLEMEFPDEDREDYIEVIHQLLDKRELLVKQLPTEYSETEKQLVVEITTMNRTINQQLKKYTKLIRADINDLKKKKETGKKYEHPYEGTSTDGMFFDKKK